MDYTLIVFRSIGSTQDWVRAWARLEAKEGLVVQAWEQTAGRGRLQRSWWSPLGGGLYLSVLLRAPVSLGQSSHLTMLASLAAIDACQQVANVLPQPKWPNDLLLAGRKLAGILTEVEQQDGRVIYAVIGLGLNVNQDFRDTPLAGTAISLRQACGRDIDIAVLRDAYLTALDERYQRFRRGHSPHGEWRERLEPLGRRVRVQIGAQPPFLGLAEEVNPEGALLVRDDAGLLHTVWAGDVTPIDSLNEAG